MNTSSNAEVWQQPNVAMETLREIRPESSVPDFASDFSESESETGVSRCNDLYPGPTSYGKNSLRTVLLEVLADFAWNG